MRQRRAVAGRFLGAVPVHHEHAAVIRREPEHELGGDPVVGGEDRAGEAALAAARERDRLRQRRRSRSRCTPGRRPRRNARPAPPSRRDRAAASAAGRRPRSRSPRTSSGWRVAAARARASRAQLPRRAPALRRAARRLASGPMRTPSRARVADDDLRRAPPAARRPRRRQAPRRHDRLADRRALLPGLHRHLAHDLAHEEVELRRAGRRVRPQHRGIERIGLGHEAHGAARSRSDACAASPRCVAEPVKATTSWQSR